VPRPVPARALSQSEREAVLGVLHCERFVDCSPAQVWATLLDEGRYLASERTMYRLLAAAHGGVRERRDRRGCCMNGWMARSVVREGEHCHRRFRGCDVATARGGTGRGILLFGPWSP
jgi:hypothetical protein